MRFGRALYDADATIERRGPAFAQADFNELRPGERKGRKEGQLFLCGLRGLWIAPIKTGKGS
jgi:hypothetical protein